MGLCKNAGQQTVEAHIQLPQELVCAPRLSQLDCGSSQLPCSSQVHARRFTS